MEYVYLYYMSVEYNSIVVVVLLVIVIANSNKILVIAVRQLTN